jgi:hypothetical protein
MFRRTSALAAVAAALLTSSACYHAVVETGRPAGTTVVQKPWVSTFVFGLVPAQAIDVSAQCPGGIAKVETQQTFVNGLVGALTFGIYTPQSATITCAAGRSGALTLPEGRDARIVAAASDTPEARAAAVNAAAEQSLRAHAPVFVKF